MHRDFSRAGHGLAELVAGHEQALAMRQACPVELLLLGVRPILLQPVSA
jgi:hypothetical protein